LNSISVVEINSPDNQNLHNNSNNNNITNLEIKSEVAAEIDDDIEIIHMSFTNKSTTKSEVENCRSRTTKHSNSKQLDSIHHNIQYSTNVSEKKQKETKKEAKMDIDVISDEDNNNDDNADNASKVYGTEKAPNKPYKINGFYSAKSSNPGNIKDEIIELDDDLQMIDDNKKLHIESVKMIYEKKPIRLKKMEHEVKTQFSEIDVVDLSDDESGIFPYSQLFDIKYENPAENKLEIKQECNDNDEQNNERIGLNEDEEIIHLINLTDDEDEDNPWLERLSRSQLLNEDKKPKLEMEMFVKDEIDLGIWENDEISSILQPDVFTTNVYEWSDNNEIALASHANKIDNIKDADAIKNADPSTSKIIEPMEISDINPFNEISSKRKEKYSKQETHVALHVKCEEVKKKKSDNLRIESDNLRIESDNLRIEPDNITKEFDDLTRKSNYLTKECNVSSNSLSVESTKSKSVIKRTTSKRLIPVIEAQNLFAKKKSQSEHKKENKEKQKRIEESQSKLTAEKEMSKIQKLKKQINRNFYDKRYHEETHNSAINRSRLNKAKGERTFITKEEKKIIIEKRKAKLKEIAEEKKKLTTEKIVKCRTAKPKAKISLTNRGDFLITEKISKSLLDKSRKPSSKPSDNQSEDLPVKKIDTLKNCKESSNAKSQEKQRSYQKQDLSKNTVDNIITTLQQSLCLDNTASAIQVTKENTNNIQNPNTNRDSKTINKERKHSNSKEKRKHEIISDHDAKASELLQSKSTERISVLVQKENFSPNSENAEKSKLMHDQPKPVAESNRPKKKVTFSDKVEIKEYEIEAHNSLNRMKGKDAPIPTSKLTKTTPTTCTQWLKLEEFLSRIFMWNPLWLEEQDYLKCMPPIVLTRELQPLKLFYTSYQEYYMIMMPLLLLEVWYNMTKDFNDVEKNTKHVTAMCYIVENSITHIPVSSMNLSVMTLMIEILVEKQDLDKTHPMYGDLVSLEYGINVHGKLMFHKVFAYVTNMHQTVITEFTNYNKDLRNYVQKPYAVITYTLLTQLLEHSNIAINRVQRVRTITYLRANIRMVQALQYLPRSPLLNLILNPKIEDYQLPLLNETLLISSPKFIEDNLNPRQLEAIYRVSEAVFRQESKVCFIQGPPGTGKSKVIVNLVSRILYGNLKNQKSLRILVCAPSNAATDEIVLRLLSARSSFKPRYGGFNIVRIGRLESMHPMAKNISVTELARRYVTQINQSTKKEEIAEDLQKRMNSLQNTLANSHNETKKKEMERKLDDIYSKYEIIKFFDGKTWDEFNTKERTKVTCLSQDMILKGANVITCTLSSCYTKQMERIFGSKNGISICIVDEATQSCEAETLIPLMLGVNTLVLVGDPNQLPATILSQQAKKLRLDQSIFSRMQNIFASQSSNPILMLDTQYRMDSAISYWPNKYFYDGRLKNDPRAITRLPFHPYIILNHNAAQNNDKFSNTTEAEFVANIIYVIMAFTKWDNIGEKVCIGILTPYNNQRTLIRNKINGK